MACHKEVNFVEDVWTVYRVDSGLEFLNFKSIGGINHHFEVNSCLPSRASAATFFLLLLFSVAARFISYGMRIMQF